MGVLQRWLDEPEESIARFAKAFYAATYVFIAFFGLQLVKLVLQTRPVTPDDVLGPVVAVFLSAITYNLAIDGRRSYKALRQRNRDPPTP